MDYPINDFKFVWTKKENATHAILKRERISENAEKKAGKELEKIEQKQTKDSHFFLKIETKDNPTQYYIMKKIPLLKTIDYEYVYKGTTKKASRHYIAQNDFIDIFKNIDMYAGKTKVIEITPPKKDRNEESKRIRKFIKEDKTLENIFGIKYAEIIMNLARERVKKENDLNEKKQELKQQIKQLEYDINEIDKTLYQNIYRNTINEMLSKNIIKKEEKKDYIKLGIKTDDFKKIIYLLRVLIKDQNKIKEADERQKKYREEKKQEEGKTLRATRGRPANNETENR